MIKDQLEFLARASRFSFTETSPDVYEITLSNPSCETHPVIAEIRREGDTYTVEYYVGDVYNNCTDYAEFSLLELKQLEEMVDYLLVFKERG